MPFPTTPHLSLLVALCESGLSGGKPLELLHANEDCWRSALAAIVHHGLIGSLIFAIRQTCEFPPIIALADRAYLAKAARTFELTNALLDILPAYRAAGIELAVLKGPALALLAYGAITKRDFTDLDLLVRPADLPRAGAILNTMGFRQVSNAPAQSDREKHIQFLRNSDAVLIELHWLLNPPLRRFPLEATGLWARRQCICFQSEVIPTLGLEDSFLALSVHGAVHGWARLKWLYDLATLLQEKGGQLNWPVLLNRAESAGCLKALLLASELASTLFHITLPASVSSRISAQPAIQTLTAEIRNSILESRPLSSSELIAHHIRVHDRLSDRLLVAYHYLPDSDAIASRPVSYLTERLLRLSTLKRICSSLLGM